MEQTSKQFLPSADAEAKTNLCKVFMVTGGDWAAF